MSTHSCIVCVTIFSTGGKFQPVLKFYIVTHSYSNRPFLRALGPATVVAVVVVVVVVVKYKSRHLIIK